MGRPKSKRVSSAIQQSVNLLSVSKIKKIVKAKLRGLNQRKNQQNEQVVQRLQRIINEQTLTCSICLQMFLHPVLGKCGHAFCLACAQLLAKNQYSCGICHSFEPQYDLPSSRVIQYFVSQYLGRGSQEERKYYSERSHKYQESQQKRRIQTLQPGIEVDYWHEQEYIWKCAVIKRRSGHNIQFMDPENNKRIVVSAQSRKLAKAGTFTLRKEKTVQREVVQREREGRDINYFFVNPFRQTQHNNFFNIEMREERGGAYNILSNIFWSSNANPFFS